MNHKPRKWTRNAMSTQFLTARDLVANERLAKWADSECAASFTDKQKRHAARHNATAMRIPRNTQVRLARAMLTKSNQYPN